jgi:hypothetical protein
VKTRINFFLSKDINILPSERRGFLESWLCTDLIPSYKKAILFSYRAFLPLALTVILAGILQAAVNSAFAADDTDDWGNPIEPPPMPRPKPAAQAAPSFSFKSMLPHLGGRRGGRSKPSAENTNPSAGAVSDESRPLDPPARPFPLLRLSRTIQIGNGAVLAPGMFLAVSGRVTSDHPFGQPPKDDKQRIMTLLQRNEAYLVVTLDREDPYGTAIGPDGQGADAPSPITKIDLKSPPVVRVETQVSEDGQSVTFLWKEEQLRFRSKPYQILVDSRPALRY